MIAVYMFARIVWAFFVLMAQVALALLACVCVFIAWLAYALVPHNEERRGRR